MDTYRARDLIHKMAEAAWVCGDPGIQIRHDHQRLEPGRQLGPPVRHKPVQRVFLSINDLVATWRPST